MKQNIFFISSYKAHIIAAFTLVELAIVLVIIGLMAGGVMVGYNMKENAELRSVAIQANDYIAAVGQFQTQYADLPGDMATATRLWGRADDNATVTANCAAPATNQSAITAGATCNGNGDGVIGLNATEYYEVFRAWQHLKNTGLINGSYSGIAGTAGTSQALVGINIPSSEYAKGGFDIRFIADTAIPADYFAGISYGHVLHFGEEMTGNNFAHGVLLSAQKAFNLDSKFDDGIPNTGNILSKNQATCVSAMPAYLATSDNTKDCTLMFKGNF